MKIKNVVVAVMLLFMGISVCSQSEAALRNGYHSLGGGWSAYVLPSQQADRFGDAVLLVAAGWAPVGTAAAVLAPYGGPATAIAAATVGFYFGALGWRISDCAHVGAPKVIIYIWRGVGVWADPMW